MNKKYLTLKSRINDELKDLNKIILRVEEAWDKFSTTNEDLYLDSVALNIHGFYAGLERIFEMIATEIDNSLPEGSAWHQNLLRQMSIEIEQVRPAVISKETMQRLDEYRGFRHVVRNIYTFNISNKRLKPLAEDIGEVYKLVKKDMSIFLDEITEVS